VLVRAHALPDSVDHAHFRGALSVGLTGRVATHPQAGLTEELLLLLLLLDRWGASLRCLRSHVQETKSEVGGTGIALGLRQEVAHGLRNAGA